MTARERTLAIGVGVAVAGFMAFGAVKSCVVAPFMDQSEALKTASTRQFELAGELNRARKYSAEWRGRKAVTVSTSLDEARRRFRAELMQVLDRHGLTADRSVTPRTEVKGQNGFIEIPVQVSVTGQLANFVGFFREFYQMPYLVRVNNLSLRAETTSAERGGNRRGGGSPNLDVSFTAVALHLPTMKDAERGPAPASLPALAYLDQPDPAAYEEITQTNIFQKYTPPPPVEPPVVRNPRPETPTPRPPQPPRIGNLVLVGTTSLHGRLVAYVMDQDKKTERPKMVALHEAIDGGTLELVHPKGVVVRVTPRKQGDEAPEPVDYFWPLGTNLRDRKPVNPVDHPEIARELELARS